MKKKILGASIGSDVHTAGLINFLELAKKEGYEVINLGGAVPIDSLITKIIQEMPNIVALSYRLGAESLENILNDFTTKIKNIQNYNGIDFIFGGTIETSEVAKKYNIFKKIFDGSEEEEDVVLFLRGQMKFKEKENYPSTLAERIEFKYPYPLIRHHIGLQTLQETIEEIKKLAESELLDIISLAPDQNCQQYFFDQEKMDHNQDGAGGAPIRAKEDFAKLYQASRRGNFPLVRCYSGTNHMVGFSKLLKETINNAWAAIPIFWYSELDRRSERNLLEAIKENMEGIRWNAMNNVPVEINDSHQWELRYAHDSVAVATAYIAAYVAKKLGVKWYIQQYMMNTPPNLSPKMDIAKAVAKLELVESLKDETFIPYRMVRTGLLSYPADPNSAMGQLVSSMFYASYLKPHIIHVVAYCEAMKRATSKEIIESIKMVKRANTLASRGLPDFVKDPEVYDRVNYLKEQAMTIINAIKNIDNSKEDPLSDPETLYLAVKNGILDATGLQGNTVAKGQIKAAVINGAYEAVDDNGNIITEKERLSKLLSN
ncbi:cobalamin B12-binding domain-containing protein [Petrotoga sp. 9PWA.NaAc.5.4]|uniref:cobalamin B12-binding domain-containing protein n=1 Tax=Petrotoga sp. 9PWA.NaAc.5.4 TaxID=1434328 RepID=UPI000CC74FD1|nr:cobalamin B12-binding domain-containing protein [Petrotoga sp. 9PWA.NaAc.5.4]PNR93681.1 methionine synthase [Petrotoga sp. 9PWA.NaAc.5.4]